MIRPPARTAPTHRPALARLPPEWAAHLESGVSHRLGGRHEDGRPEICRALAAQALPDGRIELLLNAGLGRELLAAVNSSRRIAYVASQPDTNRTLHVKGIDAEPAPVVPAHGELLARCRDRFMTRVEPFGFTRETIHGFWFDLGLEQLAALRFTPFGAWDQSPGPGAGQVIELLP
jgi:hypothetical protein